MAEYIINVAENFWNIRGVFKAKGVIDVGTHSSLVQLANGKFVLLDAYTFNRRVAAEIAKLTDDGRNIEAIINLHPFHTIHVENAHQRYPDAALYGTARHLERFPDLPWESLKSEDSGLHAKYSDDLEFSIPQGVDFISDNQQIHFSSVMAYHPSSRTIHSDDTLNYLKGPGLMRMLGLGDSVGFHPTLSSALEKRAGATEEFEAWASKMIEQWKDTENLCAAHTTALLSSENDGDSVHQRMLKALDKIRSTLKTHHDKYG